MKKCLACGGGPVIRETRQTSFAYKGQTLNFDQAGEWCSDCAEVFLDKSDRDATDPLINNFQTKIDSMIDRGETVEGIISGLNEVAQMKTKPAEEVFKAIRNKHNIP